jgi:hypothetical protein
MNAINVLNNGEIVDLNETFLAGNYLYEIKPFDQLTIDFLDKLSRLLLSDVKLKYRAEMVALGFWLRKSNLMVLKTENDFLLNSKKYVLSPIGKVFHVCPANVDTMFVYSLVVSLLMGNRNVLRISSRMEQESINLLFGHINSLINQNDFSLLKKYILIIKYDHNKLMNDWIANHVNARVIWGGDKTIATFKQSPGNPRLKDVVFSDRISISVLNCLAINNYSIEQFNSFINRFYNDSYTFDQMGCSSPQTVIFIGDESEFDQCIKNVISSLTDLAKKKNALDLNSLASLKLNRMVQDSMDQIIENHFGNNLIQFLPLKDNVDFSNLHSCGGGYFYFKNLQSVNGLNFQNAPKIQTISYEGLNESELKTIIEFANGESIDRIVKIGNALNFDYIWDGYNLFDELSKKVAVI